MLEEAGYVVEGAAGLTVGLPVAPCEVESGELPRMAERMLYSRLAPSDPAPYAA